MKRITFLLLLLPSLVFGQIDKKKAFLYAQAYASGNATINDVTYTFKNIQRTNEGIELSAVPVSGTITNAVWEVRKQSDNSLVALAHNPVATIYADIPIGFYKLKFTGRTATDQVVRTWERAFWMELPKFTEAEADVVVDLASNYYQNFAGADNSGLKIYVKNTGAGAGYFDVTGLKGTSSNYVRVQKAIGNTTIVQNGQSGVAHPFFLEGENEYIRFDGFNDDGTNGWTVNGYSTGVSQPMAINDVFRGIHIMGIDVTHNNSIDAASWSFIPTTSASYNATNWVCADMVLYRCSSTDAGEEGVYMGYNSDATIGGYRPPKFRNAVIARNTIVDSGRDGIQPGGAVNLQVHDNVIDGAGKQNDASHESGISSNSGNYGIYFGNKIRNVKMFFNIQSGYAPYDIQAGQTTPQTLWVVANDCANGTYSGGSSEPYNIYIQNQSGGASTSNWPVRFIGNSFKGDKPLAQAYFFSGSYTWTDFYMVNNVSVANTTGGDYYDIDFTGTGTMPTGSTVNNLQETDATAGDFMFTDYAGNDLTIASLSSPVYGGSPSDLASLFPSITANDFLGYPMLAGASYTFGAYSGYQKKTITPVYDDPDAATFSEAVAVTDVGEVDGTVTFEANKVGALYYSIVEDGDTAPTITQLKAGGVGLAYGQIIDTGTASEGDFTGLEEGAAYDLYCVFITVDGIAQASTTKVDFTTDADVVAPVLEDFYISDTNRDRVYFTVTDLSGDWSGSTYGGFTLATPTKTITSVTKVNSTTGYFTVSAAYVYTDASPTIAYSGSGSNIQDAASTPNALASFSATSIDNQIVPEPEEYVTWVDGVNVTIGSNGDIDSDTNSANARSSQIIPSSSDGYVVFTWDAVSRSAGLGARFGLIGASDSRTAANVDMALDLLLANTNVDVYQGTTYKTTISGGTGIQASGYQHRFRIVRATSKIIYETSPDGNTWTTRYTHDGTVTGDLRAAYVSNNSACGIRSARIQADEGL